MQEIVDTIMSTDFLIVNGANYKTQTIYKNPNNPGANKERSLARSTFNYIDLKLRLQTGITTAEPGSGWFSMKFISLAYLLNSNSSVIDFLKRCTIIQSAGFWILVTLLNKEIFNATPLRGELIENQ